MNRKSWCIIFAALIAIQGFYVCASEDRSNNSGDRDGDENNISNSGDSNDDDDDYDDDVVQWEDYDAYEVDKNADNWYFDDPFAPQDDEVLARLNAQYNRLKAEEQTMRGERKEYTIRLLTAGSVALFGIVMATFCASVSLYYSKKIALLLKYENEGIVVEARVLASDPSIVTYEQDKSSSSGKNKIITKLSSDGNSDQAIHDSYSIMSSVDGTSYQNLNASYSSIKGSSSSETHADPPRPDHYMPPTTPRTSNIKPGPHKKQMECESMWKTVGAEPPIPPTQRFAVVLEYQDIDCDVTSMIRKRLVVNGIDIKISEECSNSSRELNHKVLLYVLKEIPKSGQSCGEIHRALSSKRQLSFFFLLSFCLALSIVTITAASKMLSQTLLLVYLGVIVVLVSLQILLLDDAFENIISKQYLESGRDMGTSKLGGNPSYERNEMAETLKHGFSFA
jgi:hypothetical protein